ncbi:MAG: glycine oxidase ThiO, partial [Nitrosomonadales bacterium]
MEPDCIILGGGVIGYSTALELARAGIKISLIERNQAGQESSWAGGGILYPLLPWEYSEAVTRLTEYSTGLFPIWVDELRNNTGIDPEYRKCGMLV